MLSIKCCLHTGALAWCFSAMAEKVTQPHLHIYLCKYIYLHFAHNNTTAFAFTFTAHDQQRTFTYIDTLTHTS